MLWDLLLPSVCPLCRTAAGPALCDACRADLPILDHPCIWCAAERPREDATCPDCGGAGLTHIEQVVACWAYDGAMRELITEAKAAGQPAAVRACADLIPDATPETQVGAVVPIPPSPGRRHGPHLASACARQLARRLGVPLLPHLRTTRAAVEQHRLSAGERERNVSGLFTWRGPAPPANVLLVDDLVTSGATIAAAAASLKAAGAKRITACCLARTVHRR